MIPKVSLRDVARHCNVSAMTVSCVVRGVNCVKESTRKRVEAAIKELGYRVDPTLRALAAYRTRAANKDAAKYKASLAFFDSDTLTFSRSVYEHCRREARKRGYDLTCFKQPRLREEQAEFSKLLWNRGIRGIVFGPARKEFNLEGFQFERFAMVGIGAFHHSPAMNSVSMDYFQGLYMAAQHCVQHGYKNIGLFLDSYLEARTGHRWLGAYHAFCHHYRKKPRLWLYEKRPPEKDIRAWLQKNKIDAVLTLAALIFDESRPPGLREVFLNDWRVGRDDWHVSTSHQMIARECIHLLDDCLIHRNFGIPERPRQISIEPVFSYS